MSFPRGSPRGSPRSKTKRLRTGAKLAMSRMAIAPPKNMCWVEDDKFVWALADVVEDNDADVLCILKRGQTTVSVVKRSTVHPYNQSHSVNLDNIVEMDNMHAGPVIDLLRRRYAQDVIYTFIGDVLVSINPYQRITGLYEFADPTEFRGQSPMPHLFTVADRAFSALCSDANNNQVILSCGDSGAGKTEAAKYIMGYLANMSAESSEGQTRGAKGQIEQAILQSNPILEAFGNAKTVRNHNSSRFGKYVQIQFSAGSIQGASTRHFLLERSRLVKLSQSERTYHIFYQLCAATESEAKSLSLKSASDYAYLNQGNCVTLREVKDDEEFKKTLSAMKGLNIGANARSDIWQTLAALLHLGNLEIKDSDEGHASITDRKVLQQNAKLLGVDADALSFALCKRTIRSGTHGRGSISVIPLTAKQAESNRHALVKTVYTNLFDKLVGLINTAVAYGDQNGYIGILDIFGFEILARNGLEQLCINFANEMLQSQFDDVIITYEREEYSREGVDASMLKFEGNQNLLDLLQKKPTGILSMLHDQAKMGNGATDKKFLALLNQQHGGNALYSHNKWGDEKFHVIHYAGEVEYSIEGFLETNHDGLERELLSLLTVTDFAFLKNIAGVSDEQLTSKKLSSNDTISSHFRSQMTELMKELRATTPHFVRCVKPNDSMAASSFNAQLIHNQLKYLGVMEIVRIRREGFPTRLTFEDFFEQFEMLLRPKRPFGTRLDCSSEICKQILQAALGDHAQDQWRIGRERVFLRDGVLTILLTATHQIGTDAATAAQALVRGRKGRLIALTKRNKRNEAAVVKIQALARRFVGRLRFEARLETALTLQKLVRGRLARRYVGRMRQHIRATLDSAKAAKAAITGAAVARMSARKAEASTERAVEKEKAREAAERRAKIRAEERARKERLEEEERIRQAKLRAEEEARKARIAAEEQARREQLEAEERARQEAAAASAKIAARIAKRASAEVKQIVSASVVATSEAVAIARARAKAEAEAAAKKQAEIEAKRAREIAELKATREAEERARQQEEEARKARIAAEEQARREQLEAEERARQEAAAASAKTAARVAVRAAAEVRGVVSASVVATAAAVSYATAKAEAEAEARRKKEAAVKEAQRQASVEAQKRQQREAEILAQKVVVAQEEARKQAEAAVAARVAASTAVAAGAEVMTMAGKAVGTAESLISNGTLQRQIRRAKIAISNAVIVAKAAAAVALSAATLATDEGIYNATTVIQAMVRGRRARVRTCVKKYFRGRVAGHQVAHLLQSGGPIPKTYHKSLPAAAEKPWKKKLKQKRMSTKVTHKLTKFGGKGSANHAPKNGTAKHSENQPQISMLITQELACAKIYTLLDTVIETPFTVAVTDEWQALFQAVKQKGKQKPRARLKSAALAITSSTALRKKSKNEDGNEGSRTTAKDLESKAALTTTTRRSSIRASKSTSARRASLRGERRGSLAKKGKRNSIVRRSSVDLFNIASKLASKPDNPQDDPMVEGTAMYPAKAALQAAKASCDDAISATDSSKAESHVVKISRALERAQKALVIVETQVETSERSVTAAAAEAAAADKTLDVARKAADQVEQIEGISAEKEKGRRQLAEALETQRLKVEQKDAAESAASDVSRCAAEMRQWLAQIGDYKTTAGEAVATMKAAALKSKASETEEVLGKAVYTLQASAVSAIAAFSAVTTAATITKIVYPDAKAALQAAKASCDDAISATDSSKAESHVVKISRALERAQKALAIVETQVETSERSVTAAAAEAAAADKTLDVARKAADQVEQIEGISAEKEKGRRQLAEALEAHREVSLSDADAESVASDVSRHAVKMRQWLAQIGDYKTAAASAAADKQPSAAFLRKAPQILREKKILT